MKHSAALVAMLAGGSMLGACSTLPNSGPTANQIIRQERDPASIGFQIVDINKTGLPAAAVADASGVRAIAAMARTGRVDLVGPGDVLQINIYEVGVTLFGGGATPIGTTQAPMVTPDVNAGAQSQALNGVVVEANGSIRLPYIGRLQVAGKTTEDIQQLIVRGLRGKSQLPQALVSVVRDVTNVVYINGAVARPGRLQLSLAREQLLDAVASAGGTGSSDGPQSTIIQFTRDGRTVEAYLRDIDAASAANLVLLPGDRINLIRRPLTFLIFGASGKVSQVPFESTNLSLAEALARAGGPDDSRADPTAVFLFRDVRSPDPSERTPVMAAATTVSTTPPNGQASPLDPSKAPVIYRLDMTKPSSYFLAQRFAMRDKDVLFIANARSNQTRKLVEIVNTLFTPVLVARQVTN
jgi:polysaccharide export outer membrane protein